MADSPSSSNKTFNAKVVGSVEINAGDATKIMQGLLRIQAELNQGFKTTANNARAAFDSMAARPGDADALKQYQEALKAMQVELKTLSTYKSGINVVKDSDLQKANQLLGQMNQLARVFQDMQKQKGIEAGTFGMDSTKAKDALKHLKDLEKAAQSVNGAMSMKGDADGSLTKYKQKIDANTAALIKHIDSLRNATSMEEAHSKALIANAAREAGIRSSRAKLNEDQALAQRQKELKLQEENVKGFEKQELDKNLALKKALEERRKLNEEAALRQNQLLGQQASERKRLEDAEALRQNLKIKRDQEYQYKLLNSGSAQGKAAREGLDFSAAGRAASAYQFQQLSDRTSLLANPAFQAQDAARRQRLAEENALKAVYQQANVRPEVSGFYRVSANDTSNATRVQAAQTILGLQKQLVDLQQKGQLTDTESLRLRTAISKAIADEVQARNRAGNQQAQQNQADRNMARIGGIGGASLLAVQASLMANYSILNSMTGSVRSAISTSVELEAAFRNVQAVTATTKTEMGGLEEQIKAVAAGTKFSAVEVANAALILGQAGLDAKQIASAIQPVTMLAAAAGTNLAQAVDLVTSVVGVFDKKAIDTADVANKITQAANSSKISVDKLALGFQYAGNTAAQMGISFEETTAAMSAMANAGIKSGSTMGTGLRQFLVETQKPSEEFMATISRLGLSMADLDFKSNGLIGVARKLRDAGFIASDAIKSFDVRGAAAFNAMIANPDDMERQYRLLLNTQAGVKANEIQMDSLKSQATRLTTSLGNLASAGFEPIGKLLTLVADKMATGIQFMTEYKVTVGLLGTLIGTTLVSAMALHTASLASGAMALLGIQTASLAAFRGLTILGAGQALITGMTTGWVALRTATMAAAAAYTVAASQGVVASTLWGGAVAGLTAGLRALWVTITGMSMMTGVGLVIAGIAAAYYLWNSASSDTRDELDKLKAKSSEAKGAFQEKQDVVVSLTNKIGELNYKQSETKVSTQDLTSTAMSLNAQFGSIGLTIGENVKGYGEMITKLKQVRGEMQLLAQAKLKEAIKENQTQLTKETSVAQEKLSDAKNGTISSINSALTTYGKFLSPSQQEKLKLAKGELEAGDVSKANNVQYAGEILKSLAEAIKSSKNATDRDRVNARGFSGAVGDIDKFSSADLARRTTASEAVSLGIVQRNYTDSLAYDKQTFMVGDKKMSLAEVKEQLGGNMRAKVPTTGNKLADYDAFYAASQAEIAKLIEVQTALEKDQNNPKANKDVVNDNLRDIRGRVEGIKTDVQKFAKETQAKADREYRNESMRLKAVMGNKDKPIAAQAIRDLAELDKKHKTRAIIDPDEKFNAEQAIEETGDIRAGNKLQVRDSSHKRDIASQIRERVFKLEEARLLREAEVMKGDAVLSGDDEVSTELLKKGLKKVTAAGTAAVNAVREKQARDLLNAKPEEKDELEKSFANEIAEVKANFAARAKQFVLSFKGFTGAAAETLRMLEMKINESKNSIADQKSAGDDRVYAESSRLRELEMESVLGKKLKEKAKTDKTFNSTTRYGYSTENNAGSGVGMMVNEDGKLVRMPKQPRTSDASTTTTTFGRNGVTTSMGSSASDGAVAGSGTATTRSNTKGLYSTIPDEAGSKLTGTLKQRLSREIIRVAKIELEENDKFLALLGDSDAGLIGQLTAQLNIATETYNDSNKKLQELRALQKANGGSLTDPQRKEMEELTSNLPAQQTAVRDGQRDLSSARRDRNAARKEGADIQIKIAKNTEVLPQEASIKSLGMALDDVWNKWKEVVSDMDVVKVLGDGMASILGNTVGTLGNAFAAMATGTKTVKSAFRDMATSIIKSMVDVMAQALAMQAVKGLLSMFMMAGGLAAGGVSAAGADVGMTSTTMSDAFAGGGVMAASGGYINMEGRLERVQAFRNGGPVRGGVQGRDSVPARLMPGEFVLKSAAVNAVGTDYLHSLNQATNSVVSSSQPKAPAAQGKPGEANVVNVWVVTPDQQPSGPGPKDIIAVVSDDISRGGSVKKMIKQVIMNG